MRTGTSAAVLATCSCLHDALRALFALFVCKHCRLVSEPALPVQGPCTPIAHPPLSRLTCSSRAGTAVTFFTEEDKPVLRPVANLIKCVCAHFC